MARDLIKLPNNKWGFLILLALEALVAVWAVAVMFSAVSAGRKSTMLYGLVVILAMFYILGRSLRTFVGLLKKEREEKRQNEKEKNGEEKK